METKYVYACWKIVSTHSACAVRYNYRTDHDNNSKSLLGHIKHQRNETLSITINLALNLSTENSGRFL